jgi:hypothetical protein
VFQAKNWTLRPFRPVKRKKSRVTLLADKKKAPEKTQGLLRLGQNPLDFADVFSLQTLLTLGDVELDSVPLVQGFEPIGLDGREMHEHVLAAVLGDKSETLLILKPLHGTLSHSTNL